MPRINKLTGNYSYTQTAKIRDEGEERFGDERFAVIVRKEQNARVVKRRADGTADGDGFTVASARLWDLKPTHIVPTGQRGTITLPSEVRRNLGIEEGTPLEIIQEEDGRLSIRPLSRVPAEGPTVELSDLLARITPDNIHGEVSTGPPVGREAW